MFHSLGEHRLEHRRILPPRREEALAIIVERIARYGVSPTYDEIGDAMRPPVRRTRARQFVDQLVAIGTVERVPGSQRGIRVRDVERRRAIIETALGNGGWWHAAPLGPLEAPPCTIQQLPLMPEFAHLAEVD